MPKIKFDGMADLQKALQEKKNLNAVRRIIKDNGAELQQKAQNKAQFRGHYEGKKFVKPTGYLKQHIMLDIKDNGMTAEVEPTADYAAYVEFGTRYMDAQPYLKPAWDEQMRIFKSDVEKLME